MAFLNRRASHGTNDSDLGKFAIPFEKSCDYILLLKAKLSRILPARTEQTTSNFLSKCNVLLLAPLPANLLKQPNEGKRLGLQIA